jgi:hypothetical protein
MRIAGSGRRRCLGGGLGLFSQGRRRGVLGRHAKSGETANPINIPPEGRPPKNR